MKDKTRLGINLKIASATSVVLFTLLVSFVGIFAWFTAVQEASNGADEFKITKIDDSVKNISLYLFNDEVTVDGIKYYTFRQDAYWDIDAEDIDDSPRKLTLEKYEAEDPHHPVLLLIEVDGPITNIGVSTNHDYIAEQNTINTTNNYLSSIVQFHSFTFGKEVADGGSSTDPTRLSQRTLEISSTNYYALKVSEFTKEERKTFVNIENGDYNGAFDKQKTLFYGDTSNSAYVGIVIDYFADSLEYIYSYFMGAEALSSLNGVKFTCDWGMSV